MILYRLVSIVSIVLLFIAESDEKGGRAGGGGVRGGARGGISVRSQAKPNQGGYRPQPNPNYRSPFSGSRGGVRWSSFGSGMLAYGIMSNLASRGYHHGGYGYYPHNNYGTYRSEYRNGNDEVAVAGSTCVNNEDFNGTKFGSFMCPLPGFDPSARYCCGSLESETQYCCKFFEDDTRKISALLGILAFFSFLICIMAFVFRMIKRKGEAHKFEINRTFVSHPPNISNVNRTMGPRPGQPMPPPNRPPYNNSNINNPMYQRGQPPPPTSNYSATIAEGFPLLGPSDSNQSTPYPIQSIMPQKDKQLTEQPPPSYIDAVKP